MLGTTEDGYSSGWMDRGKELEDEAREYYEMITEQEVDEVGLCVVDGMPVSCSPDGLVGDEGLLEIKCPKLETHAGYCVGKKIPNIYIPQVQGQLWVSGRKWVDFMSYFPRLKEFIIRVSPDPDYQKLLDKAIPDAVKQLKSIIRRLKK